MRFFRESGPCAAEGFADLLGWTKRLDPPEPGNLSLISCVSSINARLLMPARFPGRYKSALA